MSEITDRKRQARKKAHASDPEPDPEFQIAPMVDILLVLLVFFMSISTTEVLQTNKEVSLPVAKDAQQAKENPGQVIVNILFNPVNNATVIEVDQQIYPSPGALVNMLDSKVRANPLMRVLIRADRDVRYEYLRTLLEAVGRSGIGNVTFAVVDKDPNAPPE
jgi:biopolymer transport protein ExbD